MVTVKLVMLTSSNANEFNEWNGSGMGEFNEWNGSGMGSSLIFLPVNDYIPSTIISHQQLYPINNYIRKPLLSYKQHHHSSIPTVHHLTTEDELLNRLEFWTV